MPVTLEVSYFNTFWLKRLKDRGVTADVPLHFTSAGPGTPEYYTSSTGVTNNAVPYYNEIEEQDWFIEESRIRGGYNNTSVDFGNKAYIVEEEQQQERLANKLIYSGVYNSRTGINSTNEFPIGEDITRAVDPASGSVQKLYAENTNLIILQEAKVNRAPIDKDVIFTQEGQPLTANSKLVIGTPSPFEGNFGISRDPGSFAVYGYNKYFTDKDRSAVLKLGPSGIEQISNMGMIDYFRDKLEEVPDNEDNAGIRGAYDIHNKNYVLTLMCGGKGSGNEVTLVYDEIVNGWTSFVDFIPDRSTSLRGQYWSFKYAESGLHAYLHYAGPTYNQFYGTQQRSSVTFIFNPQPTVMKTFKTVGYEGSNGWEATVVNSDFTGVDTNPQQPALGNTNIQDVANSILSYDEGYYVESGVQYRAGFYRKQNTYYANLINNTTVVPGEVVFGNSITGMRGFFAQVTLKNDATTDVAGAKQLFAVSSEYSNK